MRNSFEAKLNEHHNRENGGQARNINNDTGFRSSNTAHFLSQLENDQLELRQAGENYVSEAQRRDDRIDLRGSGQAGSPRSAF